MAALELRNATRSFADTTVSVSLRVEAGRRLGLVGPSGCGKTTALRMIAGLEALDEGEVLIDDQSMVNVRPERRGAVMVFQDPALFPFRTVAENVEYGLRVRRVPEPERMARVAAALASVQMQDFAGRWPGDLSGGERQRVSLARALVIEPKVLLLDEPFNSLDPPMRRDLQQLVCRLQESAAITWIFVTHDVDEAVAVSDELAVMIDGRIRQIGPADVVRARPADDEVAALLARPWAQASIGAE